ncbi:EcoT38I methyltransferase [Propionibacterium freudenreichii]|uniref:DNA cytosine methyltransferase n=1 Tax=Propionibacterium freudenreichii TaxID=1744 RepID=UPI000542639B|nr:DNA cytosine methyltransferase [Propionibacterium freudenreichii]CEH01824.1 EcoT38I methyltransferase [Propionibacterium freudenreichii]
MSQTLRDTAASSADVAVSASQARQSEAQKPQSKHQLSDYSDVPKYDKPVGTYVSLYAGAGGLDIGFALAGFAPVWVSELDKAALDTHDKAFERLAKTRPHLRGHSYESRSGDLLAIPDDELPEEGSADLVIGGPPCQGFSVAGKMDPNDERSKHVFHYMDMVERIKPKAFVLENVKALYENKRWEGIRQMLLKRADELGYNATLKLVNASHFGVPQARERMLLLGVRKNIGNPVVPEPTTETDVPTVREALSQLPHYGEPGNDSLCKARITTAKAPVLRRSPFAGMLFNGAGRPLNLDGPSVTLAASIGGNKTPIVDQRALEFEDTESWVVEYHARLWEEGDDAVVYDVPDYLRRLTVEEAAAIQTFPLGMEWCGPQSAKYRQIGNAVPPRLALAVGEAVKKVLRLN